MSLTVTESAIIDLQRQREAPLTEMIEKRDPWLTETEAAKELRVSASVVRAERVAGKLGFAKLRRRVFYPLSLLNAYKASIICQARSTSGSTLSAGASTSLGPKAVGLSVYQLAKATVRRQKSIGRLLS